MERDIEITTLLAEDLHRYFERLVLSYQDQLYAFVWASTVGLAWSPGGTMLAATSQGGGLVVLGAPGQ